jgi:hypothetical protein
LSICDLSHFGLFARRRKHKAWWFMRRVLFALSAMLFFCPVIVRTGGGAGKNKLPSFTYTGMYSLIDDGDGNRRVKFLTSGTLVFSRNVTIDVFLVGGGGGSGTATGVGASRVYVGGGGGGYTGTWTSIAIQANVSYSIVVGAGGSTSGGSGGKSWAFNETLYFANGGQGGVASKGGNGGSGGGGGEYPSGQASGNGGTNGGNGAGANPGTGQGTTTKEFGEAAGYVYSGGGAGSSYSIYRYGGVNGGGNGARLDNGTIGQDGAANTGGGAGGENRTGGSGICIIRNHRAA